MTRPEVRAFVRSGVDALSPSIRFNNGRISEFNSARDNEYPFVWMESLSVSREITGVGASPEDWAIVLHIAKKDVAGSSPEQYEAIVDECDAIAKLLTNQYNALLAASNTITIATVTRDPFIHKHADDTSGVILSFTLRTFDNSPIC